MRCWAAGYIGQSPASFYDIDEKDLQRGGRQKIIINALSVIGVQDRHEALNRSI
jgi:hypothetical protein